MINEYCSCRILFLCEFPFELTNPGKELCIWSTETQSPGGRTCLTLILFAVAFVIQGRLDMLPNWQVIHFGILIDASFLGRMPNIDRARIRWKEQCPSRWYKWSNSIWSSSKSVMFCSSMIVCFFLVLCRWLIRLSSLNSASFSDDFVIGPWWFLCSIL